MLSRFWAGVQSMLGEAQPRVGTPLLPMCELTVTAEDRIRELLEALRATAAPLQLTSAEGESHGGAAVVDVRGNDVVLRCPDLRLRAADCEANVVGTSPQGVLMLTLRLERTRLGDLWRAPMPSELLCVQSRRHRRVVVTAHLRDRAKLRWMAKGQSPELADFSEEGLGVLDDLVPDAEHLSAGGVILLDGMSVRVPHFKLVRAPARAGGVMLGLQMVGLTGEQQRTLRRWLNEAEVELSRRL